MASDWYARWAAVYAEVFGLNDEADLRTLLAWEEALGAGESELFAAGEWLTANPGAFGRTEARFAGRLAMHLGALQYALREGKAIAYRRELASVQEQGTCVLCSGSGRLIVPHLSGVRDGAWVPMKVARGGATYYTMAVWCACRLGRWLEGQQNAKWGTMLNIDQYARKNPGWESQSARRADARRSLDALGKPSPAWDDLVVRLMKQYGVGTEIPP